MGVLMAPEDPAPRKSIAVQAGSLRLPSLLSSRSLRLWPGTASHPFTSAASAALGAVTGPLDLKCPDVAPLGAAAGRWGAPEQGLECASEGMATGIMSRRCWLRLLGWGRGSVKPVTQWRGNGGLGAGCHVSKWLQLQILLSVGPNGCPEIKLWLCVRPSARAPQKGEASPSRGLTGWASPQGSIHLKSGPELDLEKGHLNRYSCLQPKARHSAVCQSWAGSWHSRVEDLSTQARPSSLPLHLGKDWDWPWGSGGKGGRATEERVRAGAAQSPHAEISVRSRQDLSTRAWPLLR